MEASVAWPVSQDLWGCYVTLKTLKNIKFGDKSTIIKVETPNACVEIPKEIDNNPEAWESVGKFYFCDSRQERRKELKESAKVCVVSYYRVDGKPEKATLAQLYQV
jgi:hypothetical protein